LIVPSLSGLYEARSFLDLAVRVTRDEEEGVVWDVGGAKQGSTMLTMLRSKGEKVLF
jgi:hypothetical protein